MSEDDSEAESVSEVSFSTRESKPVLKSLYAVPSVCGHVAVAYGDFLLVHGGYGYGTKYRDPVRLYAYHVPSKRWLRLLTRGQVRLPSL
jgi:hypothetical protein